MSRKLVSLVYERRIGSMLRKAVLSCMADRANDDGTGIWISKGRIAEEIEASRRGVITAIQEMVSEGLLIDNGQRKRGSTHDYTILVRELKKLPASRAALRGCEDMHTQDGVGDVQICTGGVNPVHRGCEPSSHEPSLNHPLTKKEDGKLEKPENASHAAADSALSPLSGQGLSADAAAILREIRLQASKRPHVSLADMDLIKAHITDFDGKTFTISRKPSNPKAFSDIQSEAEAQGYEIQCAAAPVVQLVTGGQS